jgi:hypothetical protein
MAICGRFSGCITAVEYLIVAKDATSLNMSNSEVCAYIPTVLARYDNASNPHPALNFCFDVFTFWLSATPGSFPEPNIFHRVIYRESNEESLSHARAPVCTRSSPSLIHHNIRRDISIPRTVVQTPHLSWMITPIKEQVETHSGPDFESSPQTFQADVTPEGRQANANTARLAPRTTQSFISS